MQQQWRWWQQWVLVVAVAAVVEGGRDRHRTCRHSQQGLHALLQAACPPCHPGYSCPNVHASQFRRAHRRPAPTQSYKP